MTETVAMGATPPATQAATYRLRPLAFRIDFSTHASGVGWALPFGINLCDAENNAEADVALVLGVHADSIRVTVIGDDALGEEHYRTFGVDEMPRADLYGIETAGWLNLPLRFYESPQARVDA
ncbi:hypothetical protein [Sphingomonas sp. R86521]|uniref:hypothetical protein n=1 Tax=Sphingomonas sp. R86521 TaxID=3093860 RepID=UPI0036D3D036